MHGGVAVIGNGDVFKPDRRARHGKTTAQAIASHNAANSPSSPTTRCSAERVMSDERNASVVIEGRFMIRDLTYRML